MAKIFINSNIKTSDDYRRDWWMSGEDGTTFSDIKNCLDWIDPQDRTLDIELNCNGGDVAEGLIIYDALRQSGKEISCTVVGKCASMATILLLAAPPERRRMFPHAKLLIHEPYMELENVTLDRESLESIRVKLDQDKERILSIYTDRCGVDRGLLEAQMAKDSWFGGEIAKQLGFVTEVLMPTTAKGKELNLKNQMNKKKQVTVKDALHTLSVALGLTKAEAGSAAGDEPNSVMMELTTEGGETLTIEKEEGDPAVGDKASPDGSHVMPDGSTIVVTDGEITEIIPAEEDGESEQTEEIEALKAENESLKAEIESLKSKSLSKSDLQLLNAAKIAGGMKAIASLKSDYKVKGRTQEPSTKSERNAIGSKMSLKEYVEQKKKKGE